MKRTFTRAFLFLVVFASLFSFVAKTTVFAQDGDAGVGVHLREKAAAEELKLTLESYTQSKDEFIEAITSDQPNLQKTVSTIYSTLLILMETGSIGVDGGDEAGSYFGTGVTIALANTIDGMYNSPPATTERYVAHVLESAKVIPTAQAQGVGFSSLDPIMTLWSAMRNIAYFFFVIVILVIGFMIMFRHKIDGQTVVSVQQAIPNIVVAMIFVTFSYAIGGLLIDAMYLALFFIVGIFGASKDLVTQNIFGIGIDFIGRGFVHTDQAVKSIIGGTDIFSKTIGGITGITVGAIVALGILFGVIKLFVELLKSYITIVLLITFSPIILMTGAIPGQNTFGSWIKNLVGNLIAFPTVLLILVVVDVIASAAGTTGGFVPPFLLGNNIGRGAPMSGLVGLGMLLTLPEIIKKAKEALGAKEGVMNELAGTAWGRFKEKAAIGLPIASVGTGLAGATIGGVAGGAGGVKHLLSGAEGMDEFKTRIRRGAGSGAIAGGSLPTVLQFGPKFIKKEVGVLKDQLSQVAASSALEDGSKWLSTRASERTAGAMQTVLTNVSTIMMGAANRARGLQPGLPTTPQQPTQAPQQQPTTTTETTHNPPSSSGVRPGPM